MKGILFSLGLLVMIPAAFEARAEEPTLLLNVEPVQESVKAGEMFELAYEVRNVSSQPAAFEMWKCASFVHWDTDVDGIEADEWPCLEADEPVVFNLAPGEFMGNKVRLIYLGENPAGEKPVTFRLSFEPFLEGGVDLMEPVTGGPVEITVTPGDPEEIAKKNENKN